MHPYENSFAWKTTHFCFREANSLIGQNNIYAQVIVIHGVFEKCMLLPQLPLLKK